jgi:hypothetical protein
MHDLLRGYARELTGTLLTGQEQHAALTRLFECYLHTAAVAPGRDATGPVRASRPRRFAQQSLAQRVMIISK